MFSSDFTVSEVSRTTGINKGLVSRYLRYLKDRGLLQRDLSLQTSSEVDLLVLTPEKLERIKREDPPFYNSLIMCPVTLKGEPLEEY
jgi:DNA-binding MarR family transcriptional regulator